MSILSLFSVYGCNINEEKKVQKIAYESLTSFDKEGISNKTGVVKKITTLPDNATITYDNFDENSLYSITYKNDITGDNIVIFIDAKNNKKIGVLMNK